MKRMHAVLFSAALAFASVAFAREPNEEPRREDRHEDRDAGRHGDDDRSQRGERGSRHEREADKGDKAREERRGPDRGPSEARDPADTSKSET